MEVISGNLYQIESLTIELMEEHGLIENGWKFEWDKSLTFFGRCWHDSKKITLSKERLRNADIDDAKNTILHEIAHALVGSGNGHNKIWKAKAKSIGCNAKRCSNYKDNNLDHVAKYKAVCSFCNKSHYQFRKTKLDRSCNGCSSKFDWKYVLTFHKIK